MNIRSGNRVYLTREGHDLLEQRLADIRDRRMAQLQPHLMGAERDERDVAAFEALLVEAAELDALLAEATVIDLEEDPDRVDLGVRVLIAFPDGATEWVRPVHPAEATVDSERISLESPLALALQGAMVGQRVTVAAPTGDWECEVRAIEP
jgi:transcription elongation GreA/GreB family factor